MGANANGAFNNVASELGGAARAWARPPLCRGSLGLRLWLRLRLEVRRRGARLLAAREPHAGRIELPTVVPHHVFLRSRSRVRASAHEINAEEAINAVEFLEELVEEQSKILFEAENNLAIFQSKEQIYDEKSAI